MLESGEHDQHPALRALTNLFWGTLAAIGVWFGGILVTARDADSTVVELLALAAFLLGIRFGRPVAEWVYAAVSAYWRAY